MPCGIVHFPLNSLSLVVLEAESPSVMYCKIINKGVMKNVGGERVIRGGEVYPYSIRLAIMTASREDRRRVAIRGMVCS